MQQRLSEQRGWLQGVMEAVGLGAGTGGAGGAGGAGAPASLASLYAAPASDGADGDSQQKVVLGLCAPCISALAALKGW